MNSALTILALLILITLAISLYYVEKSKFDIESAIDEYKKNSKRK